MQPELKRWSMNGVVAFSIDKHLPVTGVADARAGVLDPQACNGQSTCPNSCHR